MYDYTTPDGYGDTHFIYTVNGEDIPLVNGGNATLVGIEVDDGMFVFRVWTGANRLLAATGTVQIYDGVRNAWFQLPVLQSNIMPSGMAVIPEKVYRVNSEIRFDLANVELATNSNGTASVYADQMAFIGARRVKDGPSDPLKSLYPYYEKPFSYPFTLQINNYGPSSGSGAAIPGLATPTQYTQLITDYDFELREILMSSSTGSSGTAAFTDLFSDQTTIKVTAVTPGAAGNSISIQFVAAVAFSVSIVGDAITVNMDATTAEQTQSVISAINGSAASALVTLTLADGIGTAPFQQTYPKTFLFGGSGSGGTVSPYASPFKITLYDATWRQRSNIPVLAEFMCRNLSAAPPISNAPNNAWPCPPMMYPANSVIRFDIYSLIPTGDALPTTVSLLFNGVRRIKC